MPDPEPFEIFAAAPPGLEPVLLDEVRAHGFADPAAVPGGVTFRGDWPEVWRANLMLRGASRVLVRLWSFRALHLAQLDKRARRLPWDTVIAPGTGVRVEAVCRKSRIYHDRAAAQRVAKAVVEGAGAQADPEHGIRIMVRIEDDLCAIGLDTSGELLHKRGFKMAVAKAPMRETLAALFLAQCGAGPDDPVIDPMCGSGTFVIEAAERAAGLAPGRGRSFAFESLASFDPAAWSAMRAAAAGQPIPAPRFFGYDRDAGAIASSTANAGRAGVAASTVFHRAAISDLIAPRELEGRTGLVIINPPYGARIGERDGLHALYGATGKTLRERFAGWRVAIVTSDDGLARTTNLPWADVGPSIPHGSLRVRLYRTNALPRP